MHSFLLSLFGFVQYEVYWAYEDEHKNLILWVMLLGTTIILQNIQGFLRKDFFKTLGN